MARSRATTAASSETPSFDVEVPNPNFGAMECRGSKAFLLPRTEHIVVVIMMRRELKFFCSSYRGLRTHTFEGIYLLQRNSYFIDRFPGKLAVVDSIEKVDWQQRIHVVLTRRTGHGNRLLPTIASEVELLAILLTSVVRVSINGGSWSFPK